MRAALKQNENDYSWKPACVSAGRARNPDYPYILCRSSTRLQGVYRKIVAPERIVCTERFDDFWYAGDAIITALFLDQGEQTTLSLRLQYETQETRDAVMKTKMESGLGESYNKLAELLVILH